jgi:hypothetical protein
MKLAQQLGQLMGGGGVGMEGGTPPGGPGVAGNGGGGVEGGEGEGEGGMDIFVQSIMKQLLAKEVLYQPMKVCVCACTRVRNVYIAFGMVGEVRVPCLEQELPFGGGEGALFGASAPIWGRGGCPVWSKCSHLGEGRGPCLEQVLPPISTSYHAQPQCIRMHWGPLHI